MNQIQTFRRSGHLLTGAEARKAWADQEVRCACGDYGDAENTIAGTVDGLPAEWLGCPNCAGQAVGRPLVFRRPCGQNRAAG